MAKAENRATGPGDDEQARMDGEDVLATARQFLRAEQDCTYALESVQKARAILRAAQRAAREARWALELARSRYLRASDGTPRSL